MKVFHNDAANELGEAHEDSDDEGEGSENDLAPVAKVVHKQKSVHQGYGFVCFERCEDARKALEHFHEKGDESSVSTEFQNASSKGEDASMQ